MKLTEFQEDLLMEYDFKKTIRKKINYNHGSLSVEDKQDLYSHGIYLVYYNIHKFDESKGDFEQWLYNIIHHGLLDYYNYYIMVKSNTTNTYESKHIRRALYKYENWLKEYDEWEEYVRHEELYYYDLPPQLINFKLTPVEMKELKKYKEWNEKHWNWEEDKSKPEPHIQFKYNSIVFTDNVEMNHIVDNSNIYDKSLMLEVNAVVEEFSVIEQVFYKRVFIKEENPRTVVDDIKHEISICVDDLFEYENYIHYALEFGMSVKDLKIKYYTENKIHNYMVSLMLDNNIGAYDAMKMIKMKSGTYLKNKMMDNFRKEICDD